MTGVSGRNKGSTLELAPIALFGQPRRHGTAARALPQPRHNVLHPREPGRRAPVLWAKRDGKWVSTSWGEAAETVASLAAALNRIGLRRGDTVMLVSENRPEWIMADLAIMAAGCVTVPTYITNTTRDHQHILDDSSARAVIVSSPKLAKTLLPAVLRANNCEHVIGIDPIRGAQPGDIAYHDWSALIASAPADVAGRAAAASFGRDELACLITRRAQAARRAA
jgi:long-chain acyl-CoA synthetase